LDIEDLDRFADLIAFSLVHPGSGLLPECVDDSLDLMTGDIQSRETCECF
jgi:hypothetical protein